MSSFASAIVVGVFILTAILARIGWECYVRVWRKQSELPISIEKEQTPGKTLNGTQTPADDFDPWWEDAFTGRLVCSRGLTPKGKSVEHLVPRPEDLEFPLRPSSRDGERPSSRGSDPGRPFSPQHPRSRESMRSGVAYAQAPMRGRCNMRSPSTPPRATRQSHAWSHATEGLPDERDLQQEQRPSSRPGMPDDPDFNESFETKRPDTSWTLPGSEFMVFTWKTWTPSSTSIGKGEQWTILEEPSAIPVGSRTAWEVPESPSRPVTTGKPVTTAGSPVQRPMGNNPYMQAAHNSQRPAATPASAAPSSPARASTAGNTTPSAGQSQTSRGGLSFWRSWSAGCHQRPASKPSAWSWIHSKQPQTASKSPDSLIATMSQKLQDTRGHPLEDRKRIFRDLQRQLHPDKNVEHEEAAKLAFQELMQQRASYLAA